MPKTLKLWFALVAYFVVGFAVASKQTAITPALCSDLLLVGAFVAVFVAIVRSRAANFRKERPFEPGAASKIRLRFFFDVGTCLWAGNDAARELYDYPISPERLPIPADLAARLSSLVAEHSTSIDWEYPAGPSPWSEEQAASFRARSDEAIAVLREALGADYIVEDERDGGCREAASPHDWTKPLTGLHDAQAYFRTMGCSHFHMAREYPERYEEYGSLAISPEDEASWARADFDAEVVRLVHGLADATNLWAQHSSLEKLTSLIARRDVLRRFCEATERLVPLVPAQSRILVAETLVGRGPKTNPGGPISLARQLGDPELARAFALLVPMFCDASSAPPGGPSIDDRKASVLARLQMLRKRLNL